MPDELTNTEKMRGLPRIVAANVLNSTFCMLTFFGPVFVLFLSELDLDEKQIGMLLSLLPFSALLALFIAQPAARRGVKTTFITFYGIRKLSAVGLVLTPWISARSGPQAAFYWVAACFVMFALFRAVAETAMFPWMQEVIPNHVRGKFSAINGAASHLFSAGALLAAGYVIDHFAGPWRFSALFAAGAVVGGLSVLIMAFVPGGAPSPGAGRSLELRQYLLPLADRNFLTFLGGISAVALGVSALAFVPLFLQQEAGIDKGLIVSLGAVASAGAFLSGFLWGWASDRFGSKPVMLSGLFLSSLVPICWLFVPRRGPWNVPVAAGVLFLTGLAMTGWAIGQSRYLFVSAVPTEKKTQYMAVFYAWVGLMGGLGPILAGQLVYACRDVSGHVGPFSVGPYTPLFVLSFLLPWVGLLAIRGVRADGEMPMRDFAAILVRGSPFSAVGAVVRHQLAGDERTRIATTQQMGEAKSSISTRDLLESLSDPSFNVRYEAIVSAARTRWDPTFIEPLVRILKSHDHDLSIAAAWALGRSGDGAAIGPLREALRSGYPLLEARSARALAALGDSDSVSVFRQRFSNAENDGLRTAYASALGMLRAEEAIPDLLRFLRATDDPSARAEVALGLARIVGDERRYMRLWRTTRVDFATAASQAVRGIAKQLAPRRSLAIFATDCAEEFARSDWPAAVATLSRVAQTAFTDELNSARRTMLAGCAEGLARAAGIDAHTEYVLLALHTIQEAARHRQAAAGDA